ncbi:UNVERIFIED_CONTAM: hypothetical protein FKN15_068988 [Acipenser sinensis]
MDRQEKTVCDTSEADYKKKEKDTQKGAADSMRAASRLSARIVRTGSDTAGTVRTDADTAGTVKTGADTAGTEIFGWL